MMGSGFPSYDYAISGDDTGLTYGVYRFLYGTMKMDDDKPIASGFKTLKEASKYIDDIKSGKLIDKL